MKTPGIPEEVCFIREKPGFEAKKTSNHPVPEEKRGDWENSFANSLSRKRIMRKAQAGHGPGTVWEIPDHMRIPRTELDVS